MSLGLSRLLHRVIPSEEVAFAFREGAWGFSPTNRDAQKNRGFSPGPLARTLLFLTIVLLATPAHAHIGSKDVFEQVSAGPYKFFVTIRTPLVIPGVATVEVRSSGAPVRTIELTPIPLTGEAAKHPPTADAMKPSPEDPAFFTGSIWLMASGSWQVRLTANGTAGTFTAGVPVPAMPIAVLTMQRSLGTILGILGLLLVLGMAGIVAAAVRESRLIPGQEPTPARRRTAWIAAGLTLALMILAVYGGNKWWKVEAADYSAHIYTPRDLHTRLQGNTLSLQIGDLDDTKHVWDADLLSAYLVDHGHLMHLYAIRMPAMDAAFHLHPSPVPGEDPDTLQMDLPAMPPGTYRLYADIVHLSGFPETLTTELNIPPGLNAAPLAPEDASAFPPPLRSVILPEPPTLVTPVHAQGHRGDLGPSYKLPDGYIMVWDKPATITASTGYSFHFHLLDPTGHPATDMQPYLGMAGHAAFVKADFSTFAHTHPEGSAAMPAVLLAQQSTAASPGGLGSASMPGMDMPGMPGMSGTPGAAKPISPTVEFPYGFPVPGNYRIFIQMKHGTTVETGVFDTQVQ